MAFSSFDPRALLFMDTKEAEELMILFETYRQENITFKNLEHRKYERMTEGHFDQLSEQECWSRFRTLITVPGSLHSSGGSRCGSTAANNILVLFKVWGWGRDLALWYHIILVMINFQISTVVSLSTIILLLSWRTAQCTRHTKTYI